MLKKTYINPVLTIAELDTRDGLMLKVSFDDQADESVVESRNFFNEDENDRTNFWNN